MVTNSQPQLGTLEPAIDSLSTISAPSTIGTDEADSMALSGQGSAARTEAAPSPAKRPRSPLTGMQRGALLSRGTAPVARTPWVISLPASNPSVVSCRSEPGIHWIDAAALRRDRLVRGPSRRFVGRSLSDLGPYGGAPRSGNEGDVVIPGTLMANVVMPDPELGSSVEPVSCCGQAYDSGPANFSMDTASRLEVRKRPLSDKCRCAPLCFGSHRTFLETLSTT